MFFCIFSNDWLFEICQNAHQDIIHPSKVVSENFFSNNVSANGSGFSAALFFSDVSLGVNKFGIALVFFILLAMLLNNVSMTQSGIVIKKIASKKDFLSVIQLNALKHLVKVVAFFLVVIGVWNI